MADWPLALSQRFPLSALNHVTVVLALLFVWTFIIFIEGLSQPDFPTCNHWWFLVIGVGALLVFTDSPQWRLGYVVFATASFMFCELTPFPISPVSGFFATMAAYRPWMITSCHVSVVIGILLISSVFVQSIARAEQHLSAANSVLESLLSNMLPASIAERLRREGKTFADGYAECSVLFVDIVGFTELTRRLDPHALVRLLDEIFSRFDELTDKLGLEKIKTIGDAYMVAAGLPVERPDHAHACVELAMAIRAVIKEYAGLKVRIGINSGNVVAGIIGKRRFIYDLWGDTVNIASRMESQGLADEIQISKRTAELIADKFETTERGFIQIKGGSQVPVFLVAGKYIEGSVSALRRAPG
jgi:adenylate cyclase